MPSTKPVSWVSTLFVVTLALGCNSTEPSAHSTGSATTSTERSSTSREELRSENAQNRPWPDFVEDALVRLDSDLTEVGRSQWNDPDAIYSKLAEPKTAQQFVFRGLAYAATLNYRAALRDYFDAVAWAPELADAQYGIAVAIHGIAVIDMQIRGLGTVEKWDARMAERQIRENDFIRRESLILSGAYSTYKGVSVSMQQQGWNIEEATFAGLAALHFARGLVPGARDVADKHFAKAKQVMLARPVFQPDEKAVALLKFSNAQFIAAEKAFTSIQHDLPIENFNRLEMQSLHGRVEELINEGGTTGSAPRALVAATIPREAEQAIRRLEESRTPQSKAATRLADKKTGEPRATADPTGRILHGINFFQGFSFREALSEYELALNANSKLADGYFGKAIVYYSLAILDMQSRDLIKINNVSLDRGMKLMSAHSYIRREAFLASGGFYRFEPIQQSLKKRGWTYDTSFAIGFAALGTGQGLEDEAQQAVQRIRNRLRTATIPLFNFAPDESAIALLRLADQQFQLADDAPEHVTLKAANGQPMQPFFPGEMRSVQQRVHALLGKTDDANEDESGTNRDRAPTSSFLVFADKLKRFSGEDRYSDAMEVANSYLALHPKDGRAWDRLGVAHASFGDHEAALDCLDRALELNADEPGFWHDKGIVLSRIWRHPEAIQCFEQAVRLDPMNAEQRSILKRYNDRFQTTLADLKAQGGAANLEPADHVSYFQAFSGLRLAEETDQLRHKHKAAEYAKRAFELFNGLPGCNELAVQALYEYARQGLAMHTISAQEACEALLRVRKSFEDFEGQDEATTFPALTGYLAIAYLRASRWEEALVECQRGISQCQQNNRAGGEALSRVHLMAAYSGLGLHEHAEREARRVLEIAKASGEDPRFLADVHGTYATVLLELGRFKDAYREASLAEQVAERAGFQKTAWRSQALLGKASTKLSRHQEALGHYRAAIERAKAATSESPDLISTLLSATSDTLVKLHRTEEAIEIATYAYRNRSGSQELSRLARAIEQRGADDDLLTALQMRLNSIEGLESSRARVTSPENRVAWFEMHSPVYAEQVALLLRLAKEDVEIDDHQWKSFGETLFEIALHFADRGKAKTLLDLVSHHPMPNSIDTTRQLLAKRRQVADTISALLQRRGPFPTLGREADFERRTDEIERQQLRMRQIDGTLSQQGRDRLIEHRLFDVAKFRRSLSPREACLEYVVFDDRLVIFLVTAREVAIFTSKIQRASPADLRQGDTPDVARVASRFRRDPANASVLGLDGLVWLYRDWMDHWQQRILSESDFVNLSHQLGNVLLPNKLRQRLRDEKIAHITIVPHDVLSVVPFAALITDPLEPSNQPSFVGSRFLVQDFAISYSPSLSILPAIRDRSASRRHADAGSNRFLAFADPIYDSSDPRTNDSGVARVEPHATTMKDSRDLFRKIQVRPDHRSRPSWPRLPDTRYEAESTARLFGEFTVSTRPVRASPRGRTATICAGYAANRHVALSPTIGTYEHVLFSTHGKANMSNPWFSSIMLTDIDHDGTQLEPMPLTMADVLGLNLRADTVFLAACQTSLGRIRSGEGVVGFPLAFLSAGAETSIVSQWEVPSRVVLDDDRVIYPTRGIIVGFYRNLIQGKVSRATALRQVQLRLLDHHAQMRDPFYWGAWQMCGEWHSTSSLGSSSSN